jgi:AraC family transcriptional regulator of adaptative response/methylated-DNA-[protein]-cysteine methyltransferase
MNIRAIDDAAAWAAVEARDGGSDGRFVYAVRSTGVYCRPSCPSRRPLRRHVAFFGTPDEAEAAGYRACRRCRPGGGEASIVERVRRACRIVDTAAEPPTLRSLARAVGASPFHLQRAFTRIVGLSPHEYAAGRRVDRLKARLKAGADVTTATYDAGFGSSSRVYEQAAARLGMTPATYGRGGLGMEIRYAIAESPAGRVLVAATDRGVCAVMIGESDAPLVAALAREFPRASIVRAPRALDAYVRQVVALAGGGAGTVPIDVAATAFQWRVWRELQQIPPGETRSYAQVAAALGAPRAARAVARACASNPVALVVPCHRVIRGDGGLGGYRWGVDRKKKLLDRERSPD